MNPLNFNDLLQDVRAAVRDAARYMINTEDLSVQMKGDVTNLCTSADLAIQDFLSRELRRILPESGFLGEEEDLVDTAHDAVWIVDPIDGTANFTRGIPECCISVALKYRDEIVLGVVYNPYHEHLFEAVKGGGARLNGNPIHVSDRPFSNGLLFTAMSLYDKRYAATCEAIIMDAYYRCNDVRRSGSCALELCYIACGLCELFFEYRVQAWDYAAGYLILTEAGGVLTGWNGSVLKCDSPTILIGANTRENHAILNEIVTRHVPEL